MRAVVQRVKTGVQQRSGDVKSLSTVVMSFGDGSHGALGHTQQTAGAVAGDAYEPLPIEALPENITRVAAGHYHSLAVTADGCLWSWGRNNEGQLGRGTTTLSREQCNHPHMVEGLERVKVKDAAGSGVLSMAIDVSGSLWAWGRSKRGQLGLGEGVTEAPFPRRVQALSGQEIVQVSLGWGHALALTADCKLYSWGYPLDGRLGYLPKDQHIISSAELAKQQLEELDEDLKKEMNILHQWEPQCVPLGDLEAIGVSCGFDHSLVLCKGGILLSFGENSYGQLGRKQGEIKSVEDWRVELDSSVCYIGSGLGHSLAVCHGCREDNEPEKSQPYLTNSVQSWGWNASFQLGRKALNERPMPVQGLNECRVVSVDGGRAHSLTVSSDGRLWTWGSGRNGRLGLGSFGDEHEPCLVESIADLTVKQAVCGMDHTLVLACH